MMEISPPELSEVPLAMVLGTVDRDTEPSPPDPASALDGRLRLGGPVSVPVTTAYTADNPELQMFVEQEAAQYRYHLVHLALTATSEPDHDRFERVLIQLDLSGDGPEAPIAWSMTPDRVDGEAQLSTKWHLGPHLKLFDVSVEHTETRAGGARYLEALYVLRSDPAWELHSIRGREISGIHRLTLVVRSPIASTTRIDGSVQATLVRGRRPWRARAGLPAPLTLSAVLA